MKYIFQQLGFELFETKQIASKPLRVSYIKNSNGSFRWIWNSKNPRPDFLKFYTVVGTKAAFLSSIVKIIFYLRLQGLVFAHKNIYYGDENSFFDLQTDWSLFTGTIGPNRKFLLYLTDFFYKIPISENAMKLVQNEWSILHNFEPGNSYSFPNADLIENKILKLTAVGNQQRRTSKLEPFHIKTLKELATQNTQTVKIKDWQFFQEAKTFLHEIKDERIPNNLLRKLRFLIDGIPENEMVDLTFSHGDFTSWNCFVAKKKLALYDWELASNERPFGYDFFHYIIQNGVLIHHKNWATLHDEIIFQYHDVFEITLEKLNKWLKYYLLIHVVHYLKIYSIQKDWHIQISWLLTVWNQALNDFINRDFSPRQLLIMDFFDFVQSKEYACLKFPDHSPEKLSPDSDIDLILSRNTTKELEKFFNNHHLVAKIKLEKSSFATKLSVITKDFEILALDCLHQLKWKNLEILDANKLVKNASRNNCSIKKIATPDLVRYLTLFYHLNNANIPFKYLPYILEAQLSEVSFENGSIPFVEEINLKTRQKLIVNLKKTTANRKFNYIRNTWNYLLDSTKKKGFTITFSGVDGAGKSTVISTICPLLEKRFRKPVKVLRHRPSIFPILSVWTKGKQRAEQEVVNALPRTGTNISLLSSLFRFSYYFLDYFLGQFFVYFRYIKRGYIVVYDRYYFDLIVDDKRSNIQLPSVLTKQGYKFLLKPRYNFFLYEDVAVIRQRKKELPENAIRQLTQKYRHLFRGLRKKKKRQIYKSVKNENLNDTVHLIIKSITQRL